MNISKLGSPFVPFVKKKILKISFQYSHKNDKLQIMNSKLVKNKSLWTINDFFLLCSTHF